MKNVLMGILCLLIGSIQSFAETQSGIIYSQNVTLEAPSYNYPRQNIGLFTVSGKKTIAFSNKTIEGSREGFMSGFCREESLRINVCGISEDDAQLNMNIISESSPYNSLSSQNGKEISISAKYASTEVYFGDYLADINDSEFCSISRPLTGIMLKSDIENLKIKCFYSSPKGTPEYFRSYGNNTQGPYFMGNYPVVVLSEKVYLNGILLIKEKDFQIDYETGEIIFMTRCIKDNEIIEVYFDHLGAIYEHTIYGFRTSYIVSEKFKLGMGYINDADNVLGGGSAGYVPPYSHYVLGIDGQYNEEGMKTKMEMAYSWKDNNIINKGSSIDTGKAIKFELEKSDQNLDSYLMIKRVDDSFHYISDPNGEKDASEYITKIAYKPFNDLGLLAVYRYDKHNSGDTYQLDQYKDIKLTYGQNIYKIVYGFSDEENSRDPVYGTAISRSMHRNNVDLFYRYMFMDMSCGMQLEQEEKKEPTYEATEYQTYYIGLSTYGLERFILRSNVKIRNKRLHDALSRSKIYDIDVSSAPFDGYYLSANLSRTEDDDIKDTVSLSYQASPFVRVNTQGRYSVSTLVEEIGITREVVSRQSGIFDLSISPYSTIRFKYSFMPNLTRILYLNKNSRTDLADQYEMEYSPWEWSKYMVIYRTENMNETDTTDPKLERMQHKNQFNLLDLNIKIETSKNLSVNIGYSDENLLDEELEPANVISYKTTADNNKTFETLINHAISGSLILISRYSYCLRSIVSGSLSGTRTQNIDTSVLWNIDINWSFSGKIGFIQDFNYIDGIKTYSISPGIGFYYKTGQLKADCNIDHYIKYVGEHSDRFNITASLLYDLNNDIHSVLKASREISSNPDYRTTEIMGSVEIIF